MDETLMRIRLALTLAVRDQEVDVRIEAAKSLERIEGASVLDHLAVTAQSPDTAGALRAVYAVAEIGGERAFGILLDAMKAHQAEVRAASVKLLARTRDPRLADRLIEMLEDPDPDVKGLIVEALGDLGAPQSLDVLLSELERASGPIKEAVIAALGKLGDLRAVGVLLPLVTDDSPAIRARVAEALGRLGVRAAEQEQLKGISPPV